MIDILNRQCAPVTETGWHEIDEQAKRVIERNLAGRKVVDVSGPHGWQYGAADLGRVHLADNPAEFGVQWGMREVMPLIEVRQPFVLKRMELDNISRGCKTSELGPLQHAAEQVARFEDNAIFLGFGPGQIQGMAETTTHKTVPLPKNPGQYPDAVAAALKRVSTIGVGGLTASCLAQTSTSGLWPAIRASRPTESLKR